jgi:hypothetical protein
MAMKPLIKVTPSMLLEQQLFSCRMYYGHNLFFVEGLGTSFRSAYNNWLDQMHKFA